MTEKPKPKILIIGNLEDNHLKKFTNNLKKNDSKLCMDVFSTNYLSKKNYSSKEIPFCNNIYYITRHFSKFVYKISVLKFFFYMLDMRFSIKTQLQNRYDIVNIHYVSFLFLFVKSYLFKITNKIIISPWGSDVYRINAIQAYLYRTIYNTADYIATSSIRFRRDVQHKFLVPDAKFVNLGFGSEIIDLISDASDLTKEQAKLSLGLSNRYVIGCGYNASPFQNHKMIINSISKIKEFLPENFILLFQMTYPKYREYISEIENLLQQEKLPYIIYSEYLDGDKVVNIKKCTDLFIHIQKTDAFSGSVQEALLCNTKVINGSWLRYPDLETYGIPYYIVESIDKLDDIIISSINDRREIIPIQLKFEIEKKGLNYQSKKWLDFFNDYSM